MCLGDFMEDIFKQIDCFYQNKDDAGAYQYMLSTLQHALQDSRQDLILGILCELMSYYRVRSEFELGAQMASQAIKIIEAYGLSETLEASTIYLNVATLYRVAGRYEDAQMYYDMCLNTYHKLLNEEDERYISLYNNVSLLYQEIGDVKKALEYELYALSLIQKQENCEIETAITHSNLAYMYFSIQDEKMCQKHLEDSIQLFERYGPEDIHYNAALSLKAYLLGKSGSYEESCQLFEYVLHSIKERFGESQEYKVTLENYNAIKKQHQDKGLDICRAFYQEVGRQVILDACPQIKDVLCAGLVTHGSDSLGCDDEYSQDHDWGPGFCVWLPQKEYNIYGDCLKKAYESLPHTFRGHTRLVSSRGDNRVGIFCLEESFVVPKTTNEWLNTPECELKMKTSGEIFEDHYGEVSKRREILNYYPDDIFRLKLARQVALMAQTGQYNYKRLLKRGDHVAVKWCLMQFVQASLSTLYLLNREYEPYYKWTFHFLRQIETSSQTLSLIEGLLMNDEDCEQSIQKICYYVYYQLRQQGLSNSEDDFLESHVDDILRGKKDD